MRTVLSLPLVSLIAACASPADDVRDAFVITTIAEDNYLWARRDPELVRHKLVKMQRDPYLWLRGTAAVYWRDATSPGARATTAFGDRASSRVLLVGDPHPENLGSFRAPDGTLFVSWNDFDAVGYGPYELDVRRLAAGMIVASGPDRDATALAGAVAESYATRIAELAAGQPDVPLGTGVDPFVDEVIRKAVRDGDRRRTLEETAPVVAGVRTIPFGDLEAIAEDGVIENRLEPVTLEAAGWIATAIETWRAQVGLTASAAAIKVQTRRVGTGVSSYPALRYYVVLEGASAAVEDDLILELKEQRDGVIVPRVPQLDAAEWTSPAARIVDVQRRLHPRRDGDSLLGAAEIGLLSIRVRDRTSYQRGVDFEDITPLTAAEQVALARVFGALLASAHGGALTADGVRGAAVIAPRIAGKTASFVDEIARFAIADVVQLREDFERVQGRDLATFVLPERTE